jgi:hypothetical protein
MRYYLLFHTIICLLVLAACTAPALEPTSIAILTLTVTPTRTSSPTAIATSLAIPTFTPKPSHTPKPSPTRTNTPRPATATPSGVILPLPSGSPLPVWNGIPIMPKAIAGEEKGGSYSFTIQATAKDVQKFYEQEMPKAGWVPFATGIGSTGNLLLIFQKAGKTATIGIIAQGEITYILIAIQ